MTDIKELLDAISAIGLPTPTESQLVAATNNRKPAKWSTNGQKSDRAGFCFVRQTERTIFASFGCMRSGIRKNWSSKSQNDMSEDEWKANLKRREELFKQLREDSELKAAEAAYEAKEQWKNAKPADSSHPYLKAKKVQSHGLREEGENLLTPCYRIEDETGLPVISTVQKISPIGKKLFLKDGIKKGSFFEITNKEAPEDKLILCEGFATGASIFEATGISTFVCFDADNLVEVTKKLIPFLKEKQADKTLEITIAGDDDWKLPPKHPNKGLISAKEAASSVGAYLAIPEFPRDRGDKDTDFNDMARLYGLESVKTCIENASKVTKETSKDWPEPSPLPNELPSVKPFDPELLPEALRGWVADIAHRMNIPPDFSAVGVVVALSSLIGARAVVAPKQKDDWRVVPNLWGLIVGRPGVMKSPALSEALKPLNLLEKKEREKCESEIKKWNVDCTLAEISTKKNIEEARKFVFKEPEKARALLEASDEPVKPHMRRYVVIDSTVEALQDTLIAHPW